MYKMVHAVYNTEVDVQVYNSLSKEQNEGTNLNNLIKTALHELDKTISLIEKLICERFANGSSAC